MPRSYEQLKSLAEKAEDLDEFFLGLSDEEFEVYLDKPVKMPEAREHFERLESLQEAEEFQHEDYQENIAAFYVDKRGPDED